MERFNTNDEAYDWLEENGYSEKYSEEDINFYKDKITEIDNKIFQVRDIIDGK